jgi:hypothetical protein
MWSLYINIGMRKACSLKNDHPTNICSYLERLDPHLETIVIPCRGPKDRLDCRRRKGRVCLHVRIRVERLIGVLERLEREAAAHSVGRRVGEHHVTKGAIGYLIVVIRVAPTAQSAIRIRILPERRFKKVGCV